MLIFHSLELHTYNTGNDSRVVLPTAEGKTPSAGLSASPRLPRGFRPPDDELQIELHCVICQHP